MHGAHRPAASDSVGVLCLLLALSLFLRLPFFFPAVLGTNWDESTFILVGQSLVDGHLPYVQLWDIKPPLLYAWFALAIKTFGHDVIGIRLWGTFCVAATAWLVYLIARRWWRRSAAIFAAVLCVVGISLHASGQATLSEHVMLPAFLGMAYLWLGERPSAGRLFWIGALVATATLVRLNVAFVAAAVGLTLLPDVFRAPAEGGRRLAAYVTGGLSVVTLVCLPFLMTGQLAILWKSAVVAALERSTTEHSALESLVQQSLGVFDVSPGEAGVTSGSWLNAVIWLSACAGLAVGWWRRAAHEREWRGIRRIAVLALATSASIVSSGGAFAHYMIQLIPLAAILAAILVAAGRPLAWMMWSVTAALALASFQSVAGEYRTMVSHARAGQDLRYGAAYEIATYLRRENRDRRPVFLLTDHIVYWLTDVHPPTRIVHPSALSKAFITRALGVTPTQELHRILDSGPEYVVLPPEVTFLDSNLSGILQTALDRDYRLATRIRDRLVYRRVQGQGAGNP